MATEGSEGPLLGSICTHHRRIGDSTPYPTTGGNVPRTGHASSCRAVC